MQDDAHETVRIVSSCADPEASRPVRSGGVARVRNDGACGNLHSVAERRAGKMRATGNPGLRRCAVALLLAGGAAGLPPVSPGAAAQDLERERRLEAEIVDMILDGEPVRLEADGHSFLAIHTEADGDAPRKAVMVLHGRGFHPDWPEVAAPLRTELPAYGWETLSLQMPVLEKTARYYDYVPIMPAAFPRIRAGIEYLRARGAHPVVIAAHSCSVHMAMAFVRRYGDGGFDGFIGIGMGATDYRQPMREPFPLAAMSVPVLDLFGDEDYPAVPGAAPRRLAAIRAAGNPHSAQRIVPGAGHFFRGHDEALVDAVSEWLATLPDVR